MTQNDAKCECKSCNRKVCHGEINPPEHGHHGLLDGWQIILHLAALQHFPRCKAVFPRSGTLKSIKIQEIKLTTAEEEALEFEKPKANMNQDGVFIHLSRRADTWGHVLVIFPSHWAIIGTTPGMEDDRSETSKIHPGITITQNQYPPQNLSSNQSIKISINIHPRVPEIVTLY